jgi:hypothetical protein
MRKTSTPSRRRDHLLSVILLLKIFASGELFLASVLRVPKERCEHLNQNQHEQLATICMTTSSFSRIKAFVTVDENSNYILGILLPTKGTKSVQATGEGLLLVYNTYHHRVRQLTTDDECSLGVHKFHLETFSVVVESTPAGLYEKRIERHIQTIKDRKRPMLVGFVYKLPPQLEAEAYLEAINWINRMPNSNTGASSPLESTNNR